MADIQPLLAALVVLVVLAILYVCATGGLPVANPQPSPKTQLAITGDGDAFRRETDPFSTCSHGSRGGCPACARGRLQDPASERPERPDVYESLSRLYSTADVDPMVTGELYRHAGYVRNVYAERTSLGDVHGLTEYSSSGGAGDVGVDIGPYGLAEYGGREIGYDDGIPEEWQIPSTPIRWYGPEQRDYYGPEGATPYSVGLYSIQEPDHDPLMN
jgi:hypothetical protein